MYHKCNGIVIAVLVDFDLAKDLGNGSQRSSRHRSGTVPFMAASLLRNPSHEQTLHEDFESACYILLWTALGYKGSQPPKDSKDPLITWRDGSLEMIAARKFELFTAHDTWVSLREAIIEPYTILSEAINELRFFVYSYTGREIYKSTRRPFTPPTIPEYMAALRIPLEE
ncbi:hypothetical protein FRC17_003750 [Serendipita sp. 399]|nr:hypothetical protein FRC17_003750 [Serendipita sp. 399]